MRLEWKLKIKVPIEGPRDIYDFAKSRLPKHQEGFIVLILDAKNRVERVAVASVGTATAALVHPREVFRAAIKHSAVAVILVHNHPSGDPTPSKEDIEITERIGEAGRVVGIELLDHVVVGNGRFESLREAGYL